MRILFLPSDSGGGFGHVSRCLALAAEACDRGHDCGFILNDSKYERIVNAQFPVMLQKPWRSRALRLYQTAANLHKSQPNPPPLYIGISGMDFQVVRDGLTSQKAIAATLKRYLRAVHEFKPDILVGDTNLMAWILGQSANLPVVQIVRYAFHPETARLIWWDKIPAEIKPPRSVDIFNRFLHLKGLPAISKAEDLLRGNFYIVPSIPAIEPIECKDGLTVHVGALLRRNDVRETHFSIAPMAGDPHLIYVTIGGGAGFVGHQQFFSSIVKAFGGRPVQVVISTGGKFDVSFIEDSAGNISCHDWLPGRELIASADLVIFHGGYATMMETVDAAKPSIVVPFHTEQESNGRRLEQLGCAGVLKLSKSPYECVQNYLYARAYSYVIQRSYDLSTDELSAATEKTLNDPCYAEAAKNLQNTMRSYGGAELAMELIEHRFSGH